MTRRNKRNSELVSGKKFMVFCFACDICITSAFGNGVNKISACTAAESNRVNSVSAVCNLNAR